VFPVFPVLPVAPVYPVDPVAPVAPVAPAGPGTGTLTAAGGVTMVGLSHALKAADTRTAEKMMEYFIKNPLVE